MTQMCRRCGPAQMQTELLSGLGRLHRAGHMPTATVTRQPELRAAAAVQRHPVADLLVGTWRRRDRLPLVDASYVQLAARLGIPLLSTGARLTQPVRITEGVAP